MKKVMLVVGHSFDRKGCYNDKLKIHEYDFCMDVATRLFATEMWYDIDLVLKSRNHSYKDLPNEINGYNPDYIIELHLNSIDNKKVQGTEHLYCIGSKRGEKMANILQKNCCKFFNFNDRGLIKTVRGENGFPLLFNTKAPCVIAEPFFLSNENITSENIEDLKHKYIEYLKYAIREIVNCDL